MSWIDPRVRLYDVKVWNILQDLIDIVDGPRDEHGSEGQYNYIYGLPYYTNNHLLASIMQLENLWKTMQPGLFESVRDQLKEFPADEEGYNGIGESNWTEVMFPIVAAHTPFIYTAEDVAR